MSIDLAEHLRTDGPRISARVMDEIWESDPFWDTRFGKEKRARANEDAAFHIEYLVQAVEGADSSIMERYATWLQSVLTTRGMSTRHLDDNFARLADAITREIPGARPAALHLEAARNALRHAEGAARDLQDACERLSSREEIRYVVAHLADAIALGRPELFAAHAKWLAEIGAVDRLREALDAIQKDGSLSAETKKAARETAG